VHSRLRNLQYAPSAQIATRDDAKKLRALRQT
jgi:hypothetical protein